MMTTIGIQTDKMSVRLSVRTTGFILARGFDSPTEYKTINYEFRF